MSPRILASLVALTGLAACTETIHVETAELDRLASITIEPRDARLELTDLGSSLHALQYTAIGTFVDGTTRDVTSAVTWAIDRDALGSFDTRGLFSASARGAGHATVAARTAGVQATTGLDIAIDATIVDATFPPPASGLFAQGRAVVTDDPSAPSLAYPEDGVVLPAVIESTLFQLDPGPGHDTVRITFETDLLHLRVETGSDRWRADGTVQRLLAESARTAALRVTVEATDSTDAVAPVFASASSDVGFSTDLAATPMYYWSAATDGIMRGGVDVPAASKVYPPSATCVGCHAVSRGGVLAVAVDSGDGKTFELATAAPNSAQPLIAPSPSRPAGWSAFSPDGTRLVVANDGVLTEYDAATGATHGTIALPPMRFATHPDWAPDGSGIVVALTNQAPSNYDVKSASIAFIPVTGGTWGTPRVLVTAAGNTNDYFPRFSPDGSRIAFVRATSGSRGAASARLMLVNAAGGAPVALGNANGDHASTMPAWAPRIGSRLWLSFTSTRPYGRVAPSPPPQIWMTSLDLTATGDPSTTAFWVPCQDVTVLNMMAAWASEMVTI